MIQGDRIPTSAKWQQQLKFAGKGGSIIDSIVCIIYVVIVNICGPRGSWKSAITTTCIHVMAYTMVMLFPTNLNEVELYMVSNGRREMERAEGNNHQHSLSQTQHSPAATAKRAAVPGLDSTATANPAEECLLIQTTMD